MPEYIAKSVAIARLTALEIGNPCATIEDARRTIADTRPADVDTVTRCKDCEKSGVTEFGKRYCKEPMGAFADASRWRMIISAPAGGERMVRNDRLRGLLSCTTRSGCVHRNEERWRGCAIWAVLGPVQRERVGRAVQNRGGAKSRLCKTRTTGRDRETTGQGGHLVSPAVDRGMYQ